MEVDKFWIVAPWLAFLLLVIVLIVTASVKAEDNCSVKNGVYIQGYCLKKEVILEK